VVLLGDLGVGDVGPAIVFLGHLFVDRNDGLEVEHGVGLELADLVEELP
jgi:hypothetical protein